MRKPEKNYIDPNIFLKPYLLKSVIAKDKGTFAAEDIYDRFRRRQMMAALSKFNFQDKEVLQVGMFGPEYLKMIAKKQPKSLFGVGIFYELIEQAREALKEENVDISQFNGKNLPFPDGVFEVVFSAAFIQNIAESKIAKSILEEMVRVSNHQIIIFDDIFEKYVKTDFYRGRELKFYTDFLKEKFNLKLKHTIRLNTDGAEKLRQIVRQYFNPKGFEMMGSPLTPEAQKIEKMFFSVANFLSGIIGGNDGLSMLVFEKPIVEFY